MEQRAEKANCVKWTDRRSHLYIRVVGGGVGGQSSLDYFSYVSITLRTRLRGCHAL